MNATPDDQGHAAHVDAWLQRATARRHAESLSRAFEVAFGVLWSRAHRTLGDVTLTAIADRVLYVASEQFPAFSTLTLDAAGPTWDQFRQQVASVPEDELMRGARFVLVEFLSVLGNLTAEVLTPPLHAELERAAADMPAGDAAAPTHAASPKVNGEDTKP